PELWEAVQRSLEGNSRERRNGTGAKEPSLLAGLIVDADGKRLIPSHANKGGKRYRYYVSRSLITDPGRASKASWRLPATEVERLVVKQLGEFLCDQTRIWTLIKKVKLSHQEAVSALKRANKLAQDLPRGSDGTQRPLMMDLIERTVVHADRIMIELSRAALLKQLSEGNAVPSVAKQVDRTIVLTTPCQFRRHGGEMRLVIGDNAGGEGTLDLTLIAALARAHAWWRELCAGNESSIKHVADREHTDERYVARVLKLAFLAPDITAAILEGRQPPDLTADRLIKMPDLLPSWALQRRQFGF
ncbi:MAG: hypothetical protein ACRD3W_10605, partial [Terriglobales bacterium]